jgi:formylglycine-generating enzyme
MNMIKGSYRILRGGSWYGRGYYCEVSRRLSYGPDDRSGYSGFRMALGGVLNN